ncbi:hypothetical protein ACCO45_004666 [Purpureocillium lilacinum]|uniref:Uncharacterized protein n=1 Tax=Purpureocillium lilacinum TaxID=33203 RepID=A0ACC4DVF7_PURLI
MAIIEGWLPPTRAHYDLILRVWQFAFPPLASIQWLVRWYPMGKTSVASRLNLPGRVAWMTMEAPGFLTLLYLMSTMPERHGIDDLPWQNRVLGGLFVIHYSYRAIAFPSCSPPWRPSTPSSGPPPCASSSSTPPASAPGCPPTGPSPPTPGPRSRSLPQFALGMLLFYVGLAGNFSTTRSCARFAAAPPPSSASSSPPTAKAGLFRYMLYPHYFCEWVEWLGFVMAAGWTCAPAWAFLVNEVVSMLPRAVNGKRWYVERFGADKVGKKWAIIPGVL